VVVDQALVLERVRVRVLGLGLVQVQAHLLLRQVLAPGRVVVLVLGQKLVHMLVLGLALVQETVGVKEHGGLGMLKEE
jgi:hypothetical protein